MKAEGNRKINSKVLLQSLLTKVRLDLDRSVCRQWLTPIESDKWMLSHQLTQQGYPVIVDAWDDSLLLSEVVDTRPFKATLGERKGALQSLCGLASNLTSLPILQTVRLSRRRCQSGLR